MVKVEIVESSYERKTVSVSMIGNPIECMNDALAIVAGLYAALKKHPKGEIFADAFCAALHDDVFKGDEELKEATRKAEEQMDEELKEAIRKAEEQTDEANDFLRKFMDALNR